MTLARLFTVAALSIPLAQASVGVPNLSGWTLTWSDDFTGAAGSLPSSDNWLIDTGTSYPGGAANWGTGEVQTYTADPANLSLDGKGVLKITALKGGACGGSGQWTSARIETRRTDFACKAGGMMRIEASLNLPNVANGVGYWPAFWTLGSPFRGNYWNWPSIGEFDIMENVNSVDRVWATMHCGSNPGGPCKETTGFGNYKDCPGKPCQGNFHKFTFEIDRTKSVEAARWYVDDIIYWQILSTDLPADVWAQTAHNNVFILLNLAMGGSFPDGNYGAKTPLESTVSGGVYQIDYVAVYNK
ncbi:glycosyl hydrolase family 16 [Colletotrichum karsti]|uniref:Glycosyl hydrolase family 16 n=1 Tax=Colletotrichum karsti TaxID=1095194 RepID=A0A9P6I9U6_9PEZI|nr:glycosyl hydrolase family 16 [Colletotrichum karsti]KAF9878619.1 glycosyl hydrolase family 16 [Colletotrichum karsti]